MSQPLFHRPTVSFLSLLGLILAGGVSALAEDPPVDAATPERFTLAFRFQPGQRVSYEISHDSKIASVQGSHKEIAINKTKTIRSYRVMDVSDAGVARLEMQLDSVWMSAAFEDEEGSQGDPVIFDSTDPDKRKNPKFGHVLNTVGRPQAVLSVDPTGKTLEAKRLGVKADVEPTDAGSKTKPDNFLMTLPAQPVAVGETWKEPFDVFARNDSALTVRIRMQTVYKLESVVDGKATIGYRTVVLTPLEQPSIAAQLIQRELEGKAVFDLEQGQIASREAKLDRTVVGAFGPQSTMHAESRYKERLVPTTIAARETTSVK